MLMASVEKGGTGSGSTETGPAGETASLARIQAARGVGRCYGAMFFVVFGSMWLLLGIYASGHFSAALAAPVGVTAVAVALFARRMRKRGATLAEGAYEAEDRKKNARAFGILNGVQWVLVGAIFLTLPRFGRSDLAVAAATFVIGMHFFFMPPHFRHAANAVTGAALVAVAVTSVVFATGDATIAWAGIGCGCVLWCSALWALKTANALLPTGGAIAKGR